MRTGAAIALGIFGDRSTIASLARAMHDENFLVRVNNNLESLSRIGGEDIVLLLLEATKDKDDDMKNAAIFVFLEISEEKE